MAVQGDPTPVLQLAGIGLVPVAGLAVAVWLRGRRSPWRTAVSVALVLLLWALSIPMFIGCGFGRSEPTFQTLVPLGTALLVAMMVASDVARRIGVAAIWIAYVVMTSYYFSAVHGPRWVGKQRARGFDPSTIVGEWHSPVTHMYRVTKPVTVGCREDGPPPAEPG